ncbi:Class I monoheme cytochrome c [Oceanicola granulosus HTCC2516]|uniref:Class I monoheme cytochrome c n=1 Tax=Oceanicola granulosus (strain ATCC BAA-861 / DSM 15982 / KCTC 12143 / HTCC2516) TaxID=314256 RepID=Q2CF76_OCEGH|nr:cytochrome c [Oceanicola granulosus]EAR51251.1 Class I monoheme cytochrome c [Oceanicola granulosus HTCC2516]
MTRALIATFLLVAACAPQAPTEGAVDGRALYRANCASCHGDGGRGDGPLADGLPRAPTDLTRLTDPDGAFPMAQAMSHIDGYRRADDPDLVMPEFGDALGGTLIPFDSGDGILTPTPAALAALGEYLATLQG